MKIILTGATGMVGEGVLLHALQSSEVEEVLMINRRPYQLQHSKLREAILKDFNHLEQLKDQLRGYDACFYCAGVSSVGMSESDYSRITFDTTLSFARVLFEINPAMVFHFVTGAHTRSDGAQMWQQVKGKTEEALLQIGFAGQYNFRPGFMKPVKGQKNVRWFFKPVIALFPLFFPGKSLTLQQVGQAMVNGVTKGYSQPILEIEDIRTLSGI